jgi:hypothetical protein
MVLSSYTWRTPKGHVLAFILTTSLLFMVGAWARIQNGCVDINFWKTDGPMRPCDLTLTASLLFHFGYLNHMAGPRGPISPWLSHRLCSNINMTPILPLKATINCSHHELHGDIQIIFFYRDQLGILGVSYSFFRWIFREIIKNNFFSEVINRETWLRAREIQWCTTRCNNDF